MGELILGSYRNKICLCDWKYRKQRKQIDARICKGLDAEMKMGKSLVIKQCIQQLEEYFAGERSSFDLPTWQVGSSFQQRVWKALLDIPYGSTESYMSLSKRMADEKTIRAVAAANGANALSIIIPCHRVIGSNQKLMGYAGGLRAKKKLLELEKAIPSSNQQSLFMAS
ncbi:MAG: methylated-DNA--[protein]-cysteine S-methyltransferase [Luteibaculum sp.]